MFHTKFIICCACMLPFAPHVHDILCRHTASTTSSCWLMSPPGSMRVCACFPAAAAAAHTRALACAPPVLAAALATDLQGHKYQDHHLQCQYTTVICMQHTTSYELQAHKRY
jgi:hypothetical protein